jgi:GDP-4-dehydro-6-deoxy-D-mannose reductase
VSALITGASGFIGLHLAEALSAAGGEFHGLDLESRRDAGRSPAPGRLHVTGIEDVDKVRAIITEHRIDVVYHLAGVHGGRPPLELYRANVLGTAALLEAVATSGRNVRTLIVGSSAMYGTASRSPIDETAELRPLTPYGVSKAAADLVGFQAFAASGLPVVRVRPFNIIGPGQSRAFLLPSVAAQLVAIERGGHPPVVQLGDLSGHRDFLDVRDFVRALVLLSTQGPPGEAYNVCSGVATPVRTAVEALTKLARVPVSIESDAGRTVGVNVPHQVGSHEKLTSLTGWKPEITLSRSLVDLFEWTRRQEQAS